MHLFIYSMLALFLFSSTPLRAASSPPVEQAPYILAVHPYLPATEIQQRFTPLAKYLGKILDHPIVIRVGRDYDEHVNAIGTNKVDIAFMGPSPYVLMVALHEKKPLLARIEIDGKPYLTGVIITRTGSPLHSLSELKGRRFAFGDKESTMSSLVPQFMLLEAGVPLAALSGHDYLGGHKNVALGVVTGDYDAGAVKQEVFTELAPRGLKILANMPMVTEHAFVTRSDFPPALIEKLRQGLLNLKTMPEGKAIMQSINKGMTGMVPVADSDYQSIRLMMQSLGTIKR